MPLVRLAVPAPQTWRTPEAFLLAAMPWPVSHSRAPVGGTGISARGHIGRRSKGPYAVVYDARSGTLTPPLIEQATVEASEPTAEPVWWRRTGGKHREVINAQEEQEKRPANDL